jgi:hypothetical protein
VDGKTVDGKECAAMTTQARVVPKQEWHDFLEQLTKDHERDRVTIEVVGEEVGDQFEGTALPLDNIEYDFKDNLMVVAVGDDGGGSPVVLRHFVRNPEKVFFEPELGHGAWALDLVSRDGSQTIVTGLPQP